MNRLLSVLVLLLLGATAGAQVTTSERFGFRSVNDPEYGAACGTTSDDSSAFQAAINAANTAGGGTVYVPACTGANYYYLLTNVEVKSNVHLVCQKGAVLKQPAGAAPTYQTTGATGLVGFYGVNRAGVDGCTLDSTHVSSPSNQANPVEVRDSTPNTLGSGTRSSFITVRNLNIRAQSHSAGPYLIWAREADNVRVLDNDIDGGQTTYAASTDQQGIETIAVTKTEIAGNQISNIGRYGILVGSYSTVDQAGYYTHDVVVRDNLISVVGTGVALEAADAGTNVAYLSNVLVQGNTIRDPWLLGLRVGISGTVTAGEKLLRNVSLDGNAISMGELSQNPGGMQIQFGSANPDVVGFSINNNVFNGGKAATNGATCMLLQFVKKAGFVGNRCEGGDVTTASTYPLVITPSEATSNLSFVGNYFGAANGSSWYVGGGDDYALTGNVFEGWNATTDSLPAISVQGTANRWNVVGNKFIKDPNNASNEGYLVDGTTSLLVGWTWADNSRSWTPSFNRQADGIWDGTCSTAPGNSPQFGCVTINTGAATATVTNGLVRSGSRVYLNQTTGDPIAARAAPGSGSFVVTLTGNCTTANCTFNYEVMQ